MEIEKDYFTLPEILIRWSVPESDLVYLAENDRLCLSVRVFRLPLEPGYCDKSFGNERFRLPWEREHYSGVLDLHAGDVFHLFRCGEHYLRDFRVPGVGHVTLSGETESVFVMIGDLVLRREERDRFEAETGFCGIQSRRQSAFTASDDYQDICCHGHRYRLGFIQAQVVRALHAAALSGDPWQNGKSVLSVAGSKSLRMSDVFKSQAGWRNLIISDGRGGYRLRCDPGLDPAADSPGNG